MPHKVTTLGMKDDAPLPFDMDRVSPDTFVGEVVMKKEITPLLAAALAKGCQIQLGTVMLFEMIPAYLEFLALAPKAICWGCARLSRRSRFFSVEIRN